MTIPTTTTEAAAPTAGDINAPNNKEYNFAQIRKQLEAERAGRQQLEEKAERLEKELVNARRNADQDDDTPSDEPYVDHKALERKFKKWESNIDQRIEKKAEEKARTLVEQEKRNSYLKTNSDFNEIMQPEMMQKFVEKHPGLAEGILGMPDGFERQKLVYENIKALGLHRKEEPKPSIQETINQNRRSPYYQPSGVGTAPYASGGDFSPAGQKSSYAKLQELKSRLRG